MERNVDVDVDEVFMVMIALVMHAKTQVVVYAVHDSTRHEFARRNVNARRMFNTAIIYICCPRIITEIIITNM